MATRVAAAGGGNWTTGATWVGGVAPTAADDAQIPGTAGNITIDSGAVCRSADFTGYTGTITHTAAVTWTIGDGTAGASNIALKLVAGMTYTHGSTTTSAISFVSTSATQQTIDYGGKNTGNVTVNGASSSYLYSSGHTIAQAAQLTLTQGTLNVNGQTVTWGIFASSTTNLRTLTLGAAAVTISGTSTTVWNIGGTVANLTMTANTATVTLTGASAIFAGAGKDWNGLTLVMSGSGTAAITGANTFATYTRTGTAAKTDTLSISADQTITGTATFNSNSSINRLLVTSNTIGTPRTITAATVVVTNVVDFMDITGAGAATWTPAGTGGTLGDAGGNSGITFTTPATQTATMSVAKSWDDVTIWTSRVPLPQDDVLGTGITGGLLTANMPRLGKTLDFTGATGSPSISFTTTGTGTLTRIFGGLILPVGMTIVTGTQNIAMVARSGSYMITTQGQSVLADFSITAPGATYTLGSTFVCGATRSFFLDNGSFNTGNFDMTIGIFSSSNSNVRAATLGTSTINFIGTSSIIHTLGAGTNLTFSAASATYVIATSSSARTIGAGGQTIGTISYTVAGSTGSLTFGTGFTIGTLNASDASNARALIFSNGNTYNITNWNVNGTAGKLVTLRSTAAATYTLNFAAQASSDYLDIQNSVATGSNAYAGANSVDTGSNTGWIFTAPPVVTITNYNLYTEQAAANLLYGTAVTRYSLQEVVNLASGSAWPTQYSLQQRLNMNIGNTSKQLSVQEVLTRNLTTALSLDPSRNYTTQRLLNQAYQSAVPILTVVGL